MTVTIGEILKNRRLQVGMSQETVANQLHLSRQAISYWENNRRIPDLASIIQLSRLYQLSLDQLLADDPRIIQELAAKEQEWRDSQQRISTIIQWVTAIAIIAIFMSVGLQLVLLRSGSLWLKIVLTILSLITILLAAANNYLLIQPQYPEPILVVRPSCKAKSRLRFGSNFNPRNTVGLGIYLFTYTVGLLLIWLLPW